LLQLADCSRNVSESTATAALFLALLRWRRESMDWSSWNNNAGDAAAAILVGSQAKPCFRTTHRALNVVRWRSYHSARVARGLGLADCNVDPCCKPRTPENECKMPMNTGATSDGGQSM
jgi:hypothetical protein